MQETGTGDQALRHEVRDGERALRFQGDLLARSTSGGYGRTRWVEFELYRTVAGSYILSRVGRSIYYHEPTCSVVRRNRIKASAFSTVDPTYMPCEICQPHPISNLDEVCPEQPRHWAQVSETAEGVVASLQKYDESGARYLTNVARRLLVDAAERDRAIREEFFVEHVD